MKGKDFLSITDLEPDEVALMVQRARHIKENETPRPLEGKVLALIFEKPSLRTRVSFEVGIRQMGGDCIYLSQSDIGLGVREPEIDVARVLDRLVDGIVARVFGRIKRPSLDPLLTWVWEPKSAPGDPSTGIHLLGGNVLGGIDDQAAPGPINPVEKADPETYRF